MKKAFFMENWVKKEKKILYKKEINSKRKMKKKLKKKFFHGKLSAGISC